MATRSTTVVDLILQDGVGYKPCILRTYGRACYLPNGMTLTDYLRDLESRLETINLNNPDIEIPELGQGFTNTETEIIDDTAADDTAGTTTETTSGTETTSSANTPMIMSLSTDEVTRIDNSAEIEMLKEKVSTLEAELTICKDRIGLLETLVSQLQSSIIFQ